MEAQTQQCLDQMEERRKWFLKICEERLATVSTPLRKGEWSLAEVVEHLVLTERTALFGIERANTPIHHTALPKKVSFAVYKFISKKGIKIPVPSDVVKPKATTKLDQSVKKWEEVRAKLKIALDKKQGEDWDNLAFEHPIIGDLNVTETVDFLARHLEYHMVRTKRLLKK